MYYLHLIQVHPLMPKPPCPKNKPFDVAKIISQIGESSTKLECHAIFVTSEKLAVPVVVTAAVSVYWVFG